MSDISPPTPRPADEPPLTAAQALAEALDWRLFARRRGMDDPEIAQFLHTLHHSKPSMEAAAWRRKHGQPADSEQARAELVRRLEELAARMAEEPSQEAATLHSVNAGEVNRVPQCVETLESLKSALTALERKERTSHLSKSEREKLESLRVAVRSQRDILRHEANERTADLREMAERKQRDRLSVRPNQTAWHPDAPGVEITDPEGSGIGELLGDNL